MVSDEESSMIAYRLKETPSKDLDFSNGGGISRIVGKIRSNWAEYTRSDLRIRKKGRIIEFLAISMCMTQCSFCRARLTEMPISDWTRYETRKSKHQGTWWNETKCARTGVSSAGNRSLPSFNVHGRSTADPIGGRKTLGPKRSEEGLGQWEETVWNELEWSENQRDVSMRS